MAIAIALDTVKVRINQDEQDVDVVQPFQTLFRSIWV